MIVREKPPAWKLFFVLRGSLVLRILSQISIVAGLSLIVVTLQRSGETHIATITPLALSGSPSLEHIESLVIPDVGCYANPQGLQGAATCHCLNIQHFSRQRSAFRHRGRS